MWPARNVMAKRLVLASGSSARRTLLTNAGLLFDVVPADVDEEAVQRAHLAAHPAADPSAIAGVLASAKACHVSRGLANDLVLGADQILACRGKIYAKSPDRDSAQQVLKELRGETHSLHSAVVLARAGDVIWQHVSVATLTMRAVSDVQVEQYLDAAGAGIFGSVGCYHLEGLGVHLFEHIEGDYFTILGLPMMPLLAALRTEGWIAT